MTWLMLAACTGPDSIDPPNEEAGEVVLEVLPEVLDFGEAELGTASVQTLELANGGTSALLLTEITSSSEVLSFVLGDYRIEPGESQTVTATWTPSSTGSLSETVAIRLGTTLHDLTNVPVEVMGLSEGPEIDVAIPAYDFGAVAVACEAELPVTVRNLGTRDLSIEDITLSVATEFSLRLGDGSALPSLPWTLGPGETIEASLRFAPVEAHAISTTVQVVSNDPVMPTTSVKVEGNGTGDGTQTVVFDVVGRENVTVLFAVNEMMAVGYFGADLWAERFAASIPTFFERLQDAGMPYRVAFITDLAGTVFGSVPYIDEHDSVDVATANALAMMSGASESGDNDQQFETLQNGIAENMAWLIEDDAAWAAGKLNLVGINRDVEQSPGNYVSYLEDYLTFKNDSQDLAIHGIGGDHPTGCENGAQYYAEPYTAFWEASQATGGVFLSLCEEDWTPHMETLALAVQGANELFTIPDAPAVETLRVWIDGVELTAGWTFNDTLQAIVFDTATYPSVGAQLMVEYLKDADCG